MSERKEPDPALLQRAVSDREARPWRYYRLTHDDMKAWLEKIADERDAAAVALRALQLENQELKEKMARVDNLK